MTSRLSPMSFVAFSVFLSAWPLNGAPAAAARTVLAVASVGRVAPNGTVQLSSRAASRVSTATQRRKRHRGLAASVESRAFRPARLPVRGPREPKAWRSLVDAAAAASFLLGKCQREEVEAPSPKYYQVHGAREPNVTSVLYIYIYIRYNKNRINLASCL